MSTCVPFSNHRQIRRAGPDLTRDIPKPAAVVDTHELLPLTRHRAVT